MTPIPPAMPTPLPAVATALSAAQRGSAYVSILCVICVSILSLLLTIVLLNYLIKR